MCIYICQNMIQFHPGNIQLVLWRMNKIYFFWTKKSVLFSPLFLIFYPLPKMCAPRYFAQTCSLILHTFIINNIQTPSNAFKQKIKKTTFFHTRPKHKNVNNFLVSWMVPISDALFLLPIKWSTFLSYGR